MQIELMPLENLKPYPGNYRKHPPDQIAHLVASLEQYGQYRALVISQDDVILAGEGVWRGLTAKGETEAEVCRMPFDHTDPRAKKLLVLDNEVSRLAEDDDEQLAALLASVQQEGELIGTGHTDEDLDRLIGEIAGLSDMQPQDVGASVQAWMVVVDCADEQQQVELLERFESEGLQCRALIG